jgi:hypothetical protein
MVGFKGIQIEGDLVLRARVALEEAGEASPFYRALAFRPERASQL